LGKTKGDAAAAMKDAREKCHFPEGAKSHRRGSFPAHATGASFGGGEAVCLVTSQMHNLGLTDKFQVPGNLVNSTIHAAILCSLLSNIAFVRIAGFTSGRSPLTLCSRFPHSAKHCFIGVFATWAPHLYAYYVDHLGPLYKTYPDLKRNFLNSVFTCATFNFGLRACCFDHVLGNLSFGWCAINHGAREL
jgi:hypothetical protein